MELKQILEINKGLEASGLQPLTPCLVGETGVGKTSRIKALAEELGLKEIRILPGTELPEDLLGYPRPIKKGKGHVVEPLPRQELAEAVYEPRLVLIDELDKAREETLSGLLTLLAERRVRNLILHPDSVIVCAMQPVDPVTWLSSKTGEALSQRLLFIPIGNKEGYEYLSKKYALNLEGIPGLMERTFKLPLLETVSPRAVEYMINFALEAWKRGFQREEIEEVLFGVAFRPTVVELVDRVLKDAVIDTWEMAHRQGRLQEWVEASPVGELIPNLARTALTDWRAGMRALERAVTESTLEEIPPMVENFLREIYDAVEAAGGVLEFDPSCSEEEGEKLFRETLSRIGKELMKRR